MDPDGLPMIGSGVDYTQVGAIHQKRTLAFINYFVTSTVSFLNNFSRSCEVRLQNCESRIQKLEASLGILETKLTSIPGLEEVPSNLIDTTESMTIVPEVERSAAVTSNEAPSLADQPSPPAAEDPSPSGIPAKEDPVYRKYFKMLQVGVPEPAVRQKMQAEGLDPNILSTPDTLLPIRNDAPEDPKNQDSDSCTD